MREMESKNEPKQNATESNRDIRKKQKKKKKRRMKHHGKIRSIITKETTWIQICSMLCVNYYNLVWQCTKSG